MNVVIEQLIFTVVKVEIFHNNIIMCIFYIFAVALHQLPEPGPNMTAGPFNSRGHNVTLIMDTVYYEESTFRVCRYNRSSPKNLISCCDCYSSFCDWGELYSYNDVPDHYYSCKLKTSKVGRYQFQITTRNYPCYFNIGDPIDVNDSSDHIVYILVGCFGGLVLLLSVPIIGYCAHKKYRKYKMRHVGKLLKLMLFLPS